MRNLNVRSRTARVAAVVLLACAGSAHAQWAVTHLNPAVSGYGLANGASGTQQVGAVAVGAVLHASLWAGTEPSRIDLHPTGGPGSQANGISGVVNRQAGYIFTGTGPHAVAWAGSAGSMVDLHPATATSSMANGVDVNIVGYAVFAGESHAMIWVSSPTPPVAWVDLNPVGAIRSVANAINYNFIVGSATFGGNPRAGIWATGSPLAWNDLNPAGAVTSVAYGIDVVFSGQVVGTATFSGNPRAGFWVGTSAASWVDLHPPAAVTSEALATWRGQQVGSATFSGTSRASLWSGDVSTWEDLSLALPGAWSSTVATGIWSDGATIRITGRGMNVATGIQEALLWVKMTCYANCDGSTVAPVLTANDFQCFLDAFAAGVSYANCDGSTLAPVLTANDFQCFLNAFAAGCS